MYGSNLFFIMRAESGVHYGVLIKNKMIVRRKEKESNKNHSILKNHISCSLWGKISIVLPCCRKLIELTIFFISIDCLAFPLCKNILLALFK